MPGKSNHFNVSIVMALSLDGISARDSNHHVTWTSSEDKRFFVSITKKAGVVIMGSKTHDMIGKKLPGRKNIILTRNKNRISQDPDLIFTDNSPEHIILNLQQEGFTSACLIGGSQVNTLFVQSQLAHELYITYEPVLFGNGLSLFNREFEPELTPSLIKTIPIGKNAVCLKYKLNYNDQA